MADAGMNFLDIFGGNVEQFGTKGSLAEDSGRQDWVWVKRYLYSIDSKGEIQELDVLQNVVRRTISVSLPGDESTRGIAWDGRYFVITVHIGDSITSDQFWWIDPKDGSIIQKISNDQLSLDAYRGITYSSRRKGVKKHIYSTDDTGNTLDQYDTDGNQLTTAGMGNRVFRGLCNDSKYFWALDQGNNRVRGFDRAGKRVRNLLNPDDAVDFDYENCIAYNGRYFIVQQSEVVIGDIPP